MVSRRAKSEAQTINLSLNFPTNYDLILQQIPTRVHSFHAVTCNIQLQLLRCIPV